MELLEERSNSLILLDDSRKLLVVQKNPYTVLKHKFYCGRRIRFISKRLPSLSHHETEEEGVFDSSLDGVSVTIRDSQNEVARAILTSHETRNPDAVISLWKLNYFERFLGIGVERGSAPAELTRDGRLILPFSTLLEIHEWVRRPDGGKVVKVVMTRGRSDQDRIFTHEVQTNSGPKVVMNEIAVVLMGRDETRQLWMHVLPPEYRSRSIRSCEMWLVGGDEERDQMMDVLTGND